MKDNDIVKVTHCNPKWSVNLFGWHFAIGKIKEEGGSELAKESVRAMERAKESNKSLDQVWKEVQKMSEEVEWDTENMLEGDNE